jgi:branched-chain amino acid transport system ATP-binding protein
VKAAGQPVPEAQAPLLELDRVEAGYSGGLVLFGLSMTIAAGEAVTLLGRNGMGKTSTVHALMGNLPLRSGCIRFAGRDLRLLGPAHIARLGIGLVPEGRLVFPNLSVEENLVATARPPSNRQGEPWTLERVYGLFPRLAERRRQPGVWLSGGEQQMLAIGRALMTNPRLMILDEATEGLAPLVGREIWRVLANLKSLGVAILVIDKNLEALKRIADRHYVLEKGRIVWHGSTAELEIAPGRALRYLAP